MECIDKLTFFMVIIFILSSEQPWKIEKENLRNSLVIFFFSVFIFIFFQ